MLSGESRLPEAEYGRIQVPCSRAEVYVQTLRKSGRRQEEPMHSREAIKVLRGRF